MGGKLLVVGGFGVAARARPEKGRGTEAERGGLGVRRNKSWDSLVCLLFKPGQQ